MEYNLARLDNSGNEVYDASKTTLSKVDCIGEKELYILKMMPKTPRYTSTFSSCYSGNCILILFNRINRCQITEKYHSKLPNIRLFGYLCRKKYFNLWMVTNIE